MKLKLQKVEGYSFLDTFQRDGQDRLFKVQYKTRLDNRFEALSVVTWAVISSKPKSNTLHFLTERL